MATAREYDAYVPGLNALLRELKGLDKEAAKQLRDASADIATRHMVPAWQAAAAQAGPWGGRIAATIKARRDRVPAVQIGGNRKAFSGGATPNMVRFPSHAGRVRQSIPAAFTRTGWMGQVQRGYIGGALTEWAQAIDRLVDDFDRGRDF